MDSGFNGIYLDIIDAYEYWGPDGDSGLERATAEQDMVDFVIAISGYAKARDPDFLIYPQNGEALGAHPEYLAAVDGIGREDVWYNNDDVQDDTNTTLGYLELFSDAGKHVIVIDYPTDTELIADFIGKAEDLGYSSYPGVRDLDEIRSFPNP
jgi:cysteinyl-tRNA synthetase